MGCSDWSSETHTYWTYRASTRLDYYFFPPQFVSLSIALVEKYQCKSFNSLSLYNYCFTGLAVSNRHTYMFSAGDDKQVKCWDLEQNKV